MLLLLPLAALGQAPRDPLAPRSDGRDALVQRLHTVTVCSSDLERSRRFYEGAMRMRMRGPLAESAATRAALRRLLAIPEPIDWQSYVFDRPGAAEAARVRLLVLTRETPLIRPRFSGQIEGSLSIGFAVADMKAAHAHVLASGFEEAGRYSELTLRRPDTGEPYVVYEALFKAPDGVYGLAVARTGGMPPIGPIDEATGFGGPAYSGLVVPSSDRFLRFLTEGLGFEVRRDMEFRSSGPQGGLALPEGTSFRFLQVYAPGATTGYLVILDMRERGLGSDVAPRPPNRGVAAWSFETRDLERAKARLEGAGAPIVAGPLELDTPDLGRVRALAAHAPNGFLIELFQPR